MCLRVWGPWASVTRQTAKAALAPPSLQDLLPKTKVGAECNRLAGIRNKLLRVERCLGGGPDLIPDTELHPPARSSRKAAETSEFFTQRGQRAAPPCWRFTQRDACNAGEKCPVFQRNAAEHGLECEAFLRGMLFEGPFTPQSRFASLNQLSRRFGRDVPEELPLPPQATALQEHLQCSLCVQTQGVQGCAVWHKPKQREPSSTAEDFIGPINVTFCGDVSHRQCAAKLLKSGAGLVEMRSRPSAAGSARGGGQGERGGGGEELSRAALAQIKEMRLAELLSHAQNSSAGYTR